MRKFPVDSQKGKLQLQSRDPREDSQPSSKLQDTIRSIGNLSSKPQGQVKGVWRNPPSKDLTFRKKSAQAGPLISRDGPPRGTFASKIRPQTQNSTLDSKGTSPKEDECESKSENEVNVKEGKDPKWNQDNASSPTYTKDFILSLYSNIYPLSKNFEKDKLVFSPHCQPPVTNTELTGIERMLLSAQVINPEFKSRKQVKTEFSPFERPFTPYSQKPSLQSSPQRHSRGFKQIQQKHDDPLTYKNQQTGVRYYAKEETLSSREDTSVNQWTVGISSQGVAAQTHPTQKVHPTRQEYQNKDLRVQELDRVDFGISYDKARVSGTSETLDEERPQVLPSDIKEDDLVTSSGPYSRMPLSSDEMRARTLHDVGVRFGKNSSERSPVDERTVSEGHRVNEKVLEFRLGRAPLEAFPVTEDICSSEQQDREVAGWRTVGGPRVRPRKGASQMAVPVEEYGDPYTYNPGPKCNLSTSTEDPWGGEARSPLVSWAVDTQQQIYPSTPLPYPLGTHSAPELYQSQVRNAGIQAPRLGLMPGSYTGRYAVEKYTGMQQLEYSDCAGFGGPNSIQALRGFGYDERGEFPFRHGHSRNMEQFQKYGRTLPPQLNDGGGMIPQDIGETRAEPVGPGQTSYGSGNLLLTVGKSKSDNIRDVGCYSCVVQQLQCACDIKMGRAYHEQAQLTPNAQTSQTSHSLQQPIPVMGAGPPLHAIPRRLNDDALNMATRGSFHLNNRRQFGAPSFPEDQDFPRSQNIPDTSEFLSGCMKQIPGPYGPVGIQSVHSGIKQSQLEHRTPKGLDLGPAGRVCQGFGASCSGGDYGIMRGRTSFARESSVKDLSAVQSLWDLTMCQVKPDGQFQARLAQPLDEISGRPGSAADIVNRSFNRSSDTFMHGSECLRTSMQNSLLDSCGPCAGFSPRPENSATEWEFSPKCTQRDEYGGHLLNEIEKKNMTWERGRIQDQEIYGEYGRLPNIAIDGDKRHKVPKGVAARMMLDSEWCMPTCDEQQDVEALEKGFRSGRAYEFNKEDSGTFVKTRPQTGAPKKPLQAYYSYSRADFSDLHPPIGPGGSTNVSADITWGTRAPPVIGAVAHLNEPHIGKRVTITSEGKVQQQVENSLEGLGDENLKEVSPKKGESENSQKEYTQKIKEGNKDQDQKPDPPKGRMWNVKFTDPSVVPDTLGMMDGPSLDENYRNEVLLSHMKKEKWPGEKKLPKYSSKNFKQINITWNDTPSTKKFPPSATNPWKPVGNITSANSQWAELQATRTPVYPCKVSSESPALSKQPQVVSFTVPFATARKDTQPVDSKEPSSYSNFLSPLKDQGPSKNSWNVVGKKKLKSSKTDKGVQGVLVSPSNAPGVGRQVVGSPKEVSSMVDKLAVTSQGTQKEGRKDTVDAAPEMRTADSVCGLGGVRNYSDGKDNLDWVVVATSPGHKGKSNFPSKMQASNQKR